MIISISSIIKGYLDTEKDFSSELHRYFRSKHFKELNNTGNIWLEASWGYNDSFTLEDYMKVKHQNKIATLQYTYDNYQNYDGTCTYFRFYLDQNSINKEKFTSDHFLDMASIRFAYPIIVGTEIKMVHIVADERYLNLKSRLEEGE